MSYLRRKARGERMNADYPSTYLAVPLADELFDCIQGPFRSTVDLVTPEGQPYDARYHTYSNTVVGPPSDPDVVATLKLAFEAYLHRLRHVTAFPDKPKLFWRFRKGEHILIEGENRRRDGKDKEWRTKLYTRLVVPDCPLSFCSQCLHTEGEPHANYCVNIVGRNQVHGQMS